MFEKDREFFYEKLEEAGKHKSLWPLTPIIIVAGVIACIFVAVIP